jgi:hypothetical protein
MSPPTAVPTIAVQLDAVESLAAELATLAAELSDEAALCHSTATSLYSALGGDEGWSAGSAATAWAAVGEVVAARTGAIAGTLVAAVGAYRAADAALSERIGSAWPHRQETPR